MKCCGSPTTSTVDNAPDAARTARNAMQAVLFSEILKPMTAALGPVGDVVVGTMTQAVFVRNAS